jgi:ribosomal protein L11 methyltransferase
MARTVSVRIRSEKSISELLLSKIDALGFDGILEHSPNDFEAFIAESDYLTKHLESPLMQLQKEFSVQMDLTLIEQQNWNETWESSFEPVEISGKLLIRAPFHKTKQELPLEIIIEPKMSFGTGHHGTTHLMAEMLLDMDLKNKTVLDAGAGTGILSILSEHLGARKVVGFDLEKWAFENARENARLNGCLNTHFYLSDASGLPFGEKYFDITLANITKNVLKEDIPLYLNYLRPNGTLVISGFFETDIEEMAQFSKNLGMEVKKTTMKNNWAAIQLSH